MVVPSHVVRGRSSWAASSEAASSWPAPSGLGGRAESSLWLTQRFAEGQNYSIDLEASRAVCRVWSRPDLDTAQGAAQAVEKIVLFRRLAQGNIREMLFDLTRAPAVTGPITQAALGEMMQAWEQAGKPIAVVSGAVSIQQLQLRRLVTTFAPQQGALFTALEDATAWLDSRHNR